MASLGMTILHPADRTEWLKLRHGYVSSTESAALFSMSPYLTAFELALEKTDKLESNFKETERTAWGTRLQDAIALGIGEDYGVMVRQQSGYAVHPDARMGSSFDYEIVGVGPGWAYVHDRWTHPHGKELSDPILLSMFEKHGPGVLEIKNVDSLVYKRDWAEEAPEHIEIQVQHQLECIRYKWAVIGALVGGNRNEILIRERDAAVGLAIKSKILKFWADLAEGKMPPPTMPEDASILIRLYNYAEVDKVYDGQEDVELTELCEAYHAHGFAEQTAQEGKEIAKAKILQRIGSAERALVHGFGISAGMVAGTHIEYDRDPYRNFRVTKKKAKGAKK